MTHGHQLFLADLFTRNGQHTAYVSRTGPAALARIAPVQHRQLTLFDLPRDMDHGRRRGFRPPPDDRLAAFLQTFVNAHAAQHGWHPSHRHSIGRGVRILLALQDTPGAPIRGSELFNTAALGLSTPALTDVLAAAGFLDDDRQPPIVSWFTTQIADLRGGIREELRVWFDVMRHGSDRAPRRTRRDDRTTSTQLRYALPAIRTWSRDYESLREVSRGNIQAALPATGPGRVLTLTALRSIFTILKARRLVFVNPTVRVRAKKPNWPPIPTLDLDKVRAARHSDNPACAALAALLAFHGVRVWQLREIRRTDLRDGRLHIGDQAIPLAGPVRSRIRVYLDHRDERWPTTANPHLFVNYRSATRTHPVGVSWISSQLGMPAQTIRQDRILDEAVATNGDLRRVMDMFGLSAAGAQRYTATIDHQDGV